MKRYFVLILCCVCTYLSSQTIIIIDPLKTPIENVRVLIKDDLGNILSIEETDEQGAIQLGKFINQKISITFSHIAYNNKTIVLTSKDWTQESLLITLEEKKTELDEILLTNTIQTRRVGDTTIIRLNSFKNSTQRSILEVLQLLPDVRVNNENIIYFKNKPVTNLLFNGLPVFGNNYNTAVDNLNSKDVLEVKFIENYTDKTAFTDDRVKSTAASLEYDDSTIFSGDVTGAYGTDNYKMLGVSTVIPRKSFAFYADLHFNDYGLNNTLIDNTSLNEELYFLKPIPSNSLILPIDASILVNGSNFNNNYNLSFKTSDTEFLITSQNFEISQFQLAESKESVNSIAIPVTRKFREDNQVIQKGRNLTVISKTKKEKWFNLNTLKAFVNNNNSGSDYILNNKRGQLVQNLHSKGVDYLGIYEKLSSDSLVRVSKLYIGAIKQEYNYDNETMDLLTNQEYEKIGYTGSLSHEYQLKTSVKSSAFFKSSFLLNSYQHKISNGISEKTNTNENFIKLPISYNYERQLNDDKFSFLAGIESFSYANNSNGNFYVRPTLQASYSNLKRNETAVSISYSNDWITNTASINSPIRFGLVDLIRNNIDNKPQSTLNFNYNSIKRISVREYKLSFYAQASNLSLSRQLVIDNETTLSDLTLLSESNYQFRNQLKFNSLVFEEFFFEAITKASYGNGFINTDPMNASFEEYYTTTSEFIGIFKRVFKSGFVIALESRLYFIDLDLLNEKLTQRNYAFNLNFVKTKGKFRVDYKNSFQNIGSNSKNIFLSDLSIAYRTSKHPLSVFIKSFNIFDSDQLETLRINEVSTFVSNTGLAGRRIIFGINYQF